MLRATWTCRAKKVEEFVQSLVCGSGATRIARARAGQYIPSLLAQTLQSDARSDSILMPQDVHHAHALPRFPTFRPPGQTGVTPVEEVQDGAIAARGRRQRDPWSNPVYRRYQNYCMAAVLRRRHRDELEGPVMLRARPAGAQALLRRLTWEVGKGGGDGGGGGGCRQGHSCSRRDSEP
jgi:hypothetical protein